MSRLDHSEVRLEQALRQVGDVAAGLELLASRMGAILDELELANTPASKALITLSVTTPIVTDRHRGDASHSIGLYNPSPITVYLGVGGAPARAGGGAVSAPPNSLVVLPLWAESIDVGAAATDLAGGDVTVMLLRWRSVQPAFLGAL